MLIRSKKRAQSTAEYAILISLVVAAALGMQHEIRRALQARMSDAHRNLTGIPIGGLGLTTWQYEPSWGTKWRETDAVQTILETDGGKAGLTTGDIWWQRDAATTTSFKQNFGQ